MTTIPHEPARVVPEKRNWSMQLLVPEMWASLAIAVMWLSVLFTAIYGSNITTATVGGTSSSVPSAIIVAFFAFFGTWVVARYGFRRGSPE
jgi:multisubunit Na+/H+ antiporter MnhF subunit